MKIKFIQQLVKNEDSNYDDYFKVVYSSEVIINEKNINI
jgi:hypothetical protein